MKNSKVNVISSVQNSVSSIFSKEDVINLINSIEESSSKKISIDEINDVIDDVIHWIENNERDVLDLDNAEFEISYNNQLECTSVGINTNEIRDVLIDKFSGFAQEEDEDEQTGYVESECN